MCEVLWNEVQFFSGPLPWGIVLWFIVVWTISVFHCFRNELGPHWLDKWRLFNYKYSFFLSRWNGKNQMWNLKIDLISILTHLSFNTGYVFLKCIHVVVYGDLTMPVTVKVWKVLSNRCLKQGGADFPCPLDYQGCVDYQGWVCGMPHTQHCSWAKWWKPCRGHWCSSQ